MKEIIIVSLLGHTGLASKIIFDNLYKLQKGDSFSITILDKKYNYKIFDIVKVLPNETQYLEVKNDEKLVTLVTCTPKYINSHRLLVIARLDF